MTTGEWETRKLWSVTQVADQLGVPRRRVFRLIKDGQVKSERAGWVHLIPDSELSKIDQLLKQGSPA